MEHINPINFVIAMLTKNVNHNDCDFMAVNEGDGCYELHEFHEPKHIDPKKVRFANNFVKQIKKLK